MNGHHRDINGQYKEMSRHYEGKQIKAEVTAAGSRAGNSES